MATSSSPVPRGHRPRRLRASKSMRDAVAEVWVRPTDFIAPFFVVDGHGLEQPIASLPGVSRFSVDRWLPQVERSLRLGIKSIMVFGVLDAAHKDGEGRSATDPKGPVQTALRAARSAFGDDVVLMSDVCLCTHTDHGHCGLPHTNARGATVIGNDVSLPALAAMAVGHAAAGADVVAPSDMMDGRIAALRHSLDEAGHTDTAILSYAVKYASAFYGPFRDAAGSAPTFGDRASYQMDPRNRSEALREAAIDEHEGADMLMVKPALPYLDILASVRGATTLPVVAYNVSGEYAMIKAAAKVGALDEPRAVREAMTSIKRAGADLIVSYHAVDAVEQGWLSW
jgi:porphobilinogen synthase